MPLEQYSNEKVLHKEARSRCDCYMNIFFSINNIKIQ